MQAIDAERASPLWLPAPSFLPLRPEQEQDSSAAVGGGSGSEANADGAIAVDTASVAETAEQACLQSNARPMSACHMRSAVDYDLHDGLTACTLTLTYPTLIVAFKLPLSRASNQEQNPDDDFKSKSVRMLAFMVSR